jgi:uncharacterized membrane protein YphA (DoxX/SURF4 family)
MASKLMAFMFPKATGKGQYAYLALRLAIAGLWINSDVPRWAGLMSGHPQANGLVRTLFGPSMIVPLTYLFTTLETLGAIALILGLLTRLTSIWAIVEFAITGIAGIMNGNVGLAKDIGLLAGALVLLANGSPLLSIDGLIAKKANKNP